MKHPNKLDQQLDNLRTLQQSYDQIAGAAEAYNVGKTQLAAAITSKGVETSPTETYPEMAEKVNAISQETYEINGGEMYAKQLFGSLTTPNYWNLYEVLTQLLSDGRLVNYGGILLAEYYKGYDSLALSGAGSGGAYVVSDKDANGNFIMYTSDTTHVWDTAFDGKGNRWVAYCFADEYHNFQITDTNTSPRSIFIGRKVGTITCLASTRTSKVVVPDGNSLVAYNSNSKAQYWDKNIVFRNIGCVANSIYLGYVNISSLYVETESVNAEMFDTPTDTYVDSLVIKASSVTSSLFRQQNSGQIKTIVVQAETITADGTYGLYANWGTRPELVVLIGETMSVKAGTVKGQNIPRLFVGYIENDKTKSCTFYGGSTYTKVLIQDGWCKPLDISVYTGMVESEIYANILQRLKQDEEDCGDGVTITLGSTNLAKLTSQESIDLLDLLTNTYGYTFA